MGRQLRFYMLEEDEAEFLDFVLQRPSARILKTRSNTQDFSLDRSDLLKGLIKQCFIYDTSFQWDNNLVRRIEHEKGNFYTFDRFSLPVIEYSQSYINDEGIFVEGRIWAEMQKVVGDEFMPKDPRFVTWYEEIVKWLRKHLKRDSALDAYVGKQARAWLDNHPTWYDRLSGRLIV